MADMERVCLPGSWRRGRSTLGPQGQKLPPYLSPAAKFYIENMSHKVEMKSFCVSIRSKGHPGEKCSHKALAGKEWCGTHAKQAAPVRFVMTAAAAAVEKIVHIASAEDKVAAVQVIQKVWNRWLARRAGPLLKFRDESNNPYDFYSSDPVTSIKIRNFVSFVDKAKGYCMDIQSAVSLLDHATKSKETPLNPFNREPLPATFLRRIRLHGHTALWTGLTAITEVQQIQLAVTDAFRLIEDLGYYTDPDWFLSLSGIELLRLYIELADIWYHRAGLSHEDRIRIVPGPRKPFPVRVQVAYTLDEVALRKLVLETCRLLVSTAAARSDKQLGVIYVLGALSMLNSAAGAANPMFMEMFSPGVCRIVGNTIQLLHPSALNY